MLHRKTILSAAAVPAMAALGFSALAAAPAAHAAQATATTVNVAATSSRPLMTGDRGSDVSGWQQNIDRVSGKIPGVPRIATDGIYGPRTAAATRDFQRFAHVVVDGVVGPHTRAAMSTTLHGSQH